MKLPGVNLNHLVSIDFLVIVVVVVCSNPSSEVPPPFVEAASMNHFVLPDVILSYPASF